MRVLGRCAATHVDCPKAQRYKTGIGSRNIHHYTQSGPSTVIRLSVGSNHLALSFLGRRSFLWCFVPDYGNMDMGLQGQMDQHSYLPSGNHTDSQTGHHEYMRCINWYYKSKNNSCFRKSNWRAMTEATRTYRFTSRLSEYASLFVFSKGVHAK